MIKTSRRQFLKSSTGLVGIMSWPGFASLCILSNNAIPKRKNPLRLIVDADTANEVDDLFAIARALIEPGFKIEGITSAQWHTQDRAPNDTVSLSQQFNEDILSLMGKEDVPHPKGSNFPLLNKLRPQPSEAADFIIKQAKATPKGEKLSIAILGPCTNLASAVLLEPAIIPMIKAYYIGFWHHLPTNTWNKREFNTNNDPNAVNVLLDTLGLEFHVMTASTSQHLVFEKTEVDQNLKGKGGIGDYMVNRWENYDRFWSKEDPEKTKWIMWDVAIIEALANPNFAKEDTVITPHDNLNRQIKAYTSIDVPKMKKRYWEAFDTFWKGR